ncbi:MAG: Gfo/Idh/MocA family oxidoreductase [Puniceicoccales bacterium]|jgi:predicted dehydrogenase|nr:Gfo/Idh/MocA family oxidoreductase [Puniceicoccales bacterium]
MSRRIFLRNTGLAIAAGAVFPNLVPARAMGRDGGVAPSNRLTMGLVGTGQGWSDMQGFLAHKDVQATAICDVDSNEARRIARAVDARYRTNGTRAYQDFREMFAKEKLDTVIIAPPDHWHAIIAIAAARAGVDIYGEKPLAHTLVEGRAIANAVKQHGRVWQTGSWQRSGSAFYRAVSLVRAGVIGRVSHVKVGTLATQNGFSRSLGTKPDPELIGKPPAHLDYDLWLGPAAHMEYDPRFVKYNWRWILNFGGGNLMDWVGHHVDIAQWGLDFDETGPAKITGKAEFSTKLPWDAPTKYEYECTYANGQVIQVNSGFADGTRFIGEDGRHIYVTRGRLTASKGVLETKIGSDAKTTYQSLDHNRNFLDCVKSRRTTITPVETAHRAASVGHLGQIACLTGRAIHWDPVTETIANDPAATALLSPVYRRPWVL